MSTYNIRHESDGTFTIVRLRGSITDRLVATASIDRAEELLVRLNEGATLIEALANISGFALLSSKG